MPLSEFQLIEKYFSTPFTGDDGAVVKVAPGMSRVGVAETVTANSANINTDHPRTVGHRVLSTALNRLAALGATPVWMTLALTLPDSQESWLQPFSEGLLTLARRFEIALIGGDTTQGPLTITVMLDGFITRGSQLPAGPSAEDDVYISGSLATAALALIATSNPQMCSERQRRRALMDLEYPEPQVALGCGLGGIASATADLSKGLTHGLESLLTGNPLGAQLYLDRLPVAEMVKNQLALAPAYRPWLSQSGDHELLFCVPASRQQHLHQVLQHLGVVATMVGKIVTEPGLRFIEGA